MTSFRFTMKVYSEDTDSFGVVHHANYIKFMERARLEWLLQLGLRIDQLLADGILFVVQHITIDYLAAARLYDQLDIISEVIASRKVAKVYQHTICSTQNNQKIYCRAKLTVVCVNQQLRPRALPLALKENKS